MSELVKEAPSKKDILAFGEKNPNLVIRELNNRSLHHFLLYFWSIISPHDFQSNWHITYLCKQLEDMAYLVGDRKPREHDLLINVPPGSTKTVLVSIMFPIWCWTKWPWMRFITASYSGALSLESADYCRDIIRSSEFKQIYPELGIQEDKDTKSNFSIVKRLVGKPGFVGKKQVGGKRYSTSVGGTLTGFHGDIIIVDDPLNPTQASSDLQLEIANRWMSQTLPTRKTKKDVTPIILIMQRLHENDPTGNWLDRSTSKTFHISIPGECRGYKEQVKPKELLQYYKDDLMDINRLSWSMLNDLEAALGQYGYAGQIGQNPVPPGGGMFKVDHFVTLDRAPSVRSIVHTVRYWDKAGTEGAGAYTAGVKMCQLVNGKWVVLDVKRGRWGTDERERIIRETAEGDGHDVMVWLEQEPGSAGKESGEGTIRNLGGYSAEKERPTGDKTTRADPFSVQVNNGNVLLLLGMWNKEYVDELRFFPFSKFKDMTDASSGAFSKLVSKKLARRII